MSHARTAPRTRARSGAVFTLVAVVLLGLIGAPSAGATIQPARTAAAAVSIVTITGHGNGHGRGLGQYGAYGYATMYHWTARQILAHFYGGTSLSRPAAAVAGAHVSVRLTSLDGVDVRVTSDAPFTVGSLRFAKGQAAVLRYAAGGLIRVYRGTGCGGAVSASSTVTTGLIRSSVAPGSDVSKMLSVCQLGTRKAYRGYLTFLSADRTLAGRRLVNTVGLDDYLKGVVPREMPASWADAAAGRGAQALQAQTVAARSYALAQRRASYAMTCDTASCQVYGGAGRNGRSLEDARSTAAVTATTGLALVRSGAVVSAEFSASTGGWTAGGSFPSVADAGDATSINPYHAWTTRKNIAGLGPSNGVGTLTAARVLTTDAHGRVLTVRLTGVSGGVTKAATISGDQFRIAVGLLSTWFRIG